MSRPFGLKNLRCSWVAFGIAGVITRTHSSDWLKKLNEVAVTPSWRFCLVEASSMREPMGGGPAIDKSGIGPPAVVPPVVVPPVVVPPVVAPGCLQPASRPKSTIAVSRVCISLSSRPQRQVDERGVQVGTGDRHPDE